MRLIFITILTIFNSNIFGQQNQKIEIPKGIVYKYCDSITNENAKDIINKEMSDSPTYLLDNGIVFIGPVLWSRYEKVKSLKKIKGGNMTILGYKKETSTGKVTQDSTDFKLVWDYLRNEVNGKDFKLRKATPSELKYYWSVISFDIEEPLIILETKEHNYILDLNKKDFKLTWLDEVPRN